MAVTGGLTNSCEKREAKSKGEKERYTHLNVEFQRIARRDKKAFLSDQYKEIEENNRKGKLYLNGCRALENSKERKEGLLQRTIQRNRGKQ